MLVEQARVGLARLASVGVLRYAHRDLQEHFGRRSALVVVAVVLTCAACLPSALSLPEHGDEEIYAWSSHYYLVKMSNLEFAQSGVSTYQEPGWDPLSVWSLTGPTLTRVFFGVVEAVTGVPVPAAPYIWPDASSRDSVTVPPQGEEAHLQARSLLTLRLAAILAAAIGFGLFTFRLGLVGFLATVFMLLIPGVTGDLSRTWAEGPLFLALGICGVAFGTRWFGPACGLAVTFKLTALVMWPLLLLRGASGKSGRARWLGVGLAPIVFSALTPASWHFGGPLYLIAMMFYRAEWYQAFSAKITHVPGYVPPSAEVTSSVGVFLPTRYLLPLEWLAALTVAYGLVRAIPWARSAGARAQALSEVG